MPSSRVVWMIGVMLVVLRSSATVGHATDNYEYGVDEYVTVAKGLSPDGKWAVTAHGDGEYGYGRFHLYLTDAVTGKKVGPLEEVKDALDTGAGSFCASWTADSELVLIVYRIDRHAPLRVYLYQISKGRAFLVKGPFDAPEELAWYWNRHCSKNRSIEKTFGTPKARE